MSKILTWLIIAAACVLLPLGMFALSSEYNYCAGHAGEYVSERAENSYTHHAIENPTAFRLLVYCGGVYAADNAETLTGIATVLLTIATFLLGFLALDQKQTSQAQLRAYLGAKSRLCIIKNGILQIEFEIINFGQTPAYDVRTVSEGWIDLVGGTRAADLTDVDDNPTCVGPADKFSLFIEVDYKPDDIIGVRDGTRVIRGALDITYKDVFKRSRSVTGKYELSGAARFDDQDDRRMYLVGYSSD